MIGHCARFQENDDLPLPQGPAKKKKPPFFNALVLITHDIMHSRDVQCNTGERLKARAKLIHAAMQTVIT